MTRAGAAVDLLLQAPILDQTGLPPVPEDPRGMGRHVSWVVCAQGPLFHYGPRVIEVTPEWIDGRVAAFWAHRTSKPGWIPPIQLNHTDSGEREGDFFDIRRATLGKVTDDGLDWDDPRDTLLAAVVWADPDAEAKIKAKILTHVSIGIAGGVQRPDTGEMLEGVPIEITKTALPHMGSAAILNGVVMADKPEDMVETPPEKEEIEAAEDMTPMDPMSVVMDMLERILKIVAPQPAAPAAEMTTVEAQVVELKTLLTREKEAREKAERQARKLSFDQAYPEGGSIACTADVRDWLFSAYETKPEGFQAVEKAYKAPKQAEIKATAPVVVRANPWEHRVGQAHANAPVTDDNLTITMSAIDAEATTDGKIDHALALQLHKQYRAQGFTILKTEEAKA